MRLAGAVLAMGLTVAIQLARVVSSEPKRRAPRLFFYVDPNEAVAQRNSNNVTTSHRIHRP